MVFGFINLSLIYYSPLTLWFRPPPRRTRLCRLNRSTHSGSSCQKKLNKEQTCSKSFFSLSLFSPSLSQLNPKGQQLLRVNVEASKIKSEKVYLLLRLEGKVTFFKVKLGKLIGSRTSKNQSSLLSINGHYFSAV